MASSSAPAHKHKGGTAGFLLLVVIGLFLVFLIRSGFALLLLGLLPTIIAYYADTTRERFGMFTIACCNISGVLPYLVELQQMGNAWEHLGSYLSNATVWLSMYGMAALGHVLVKGCPMAYHYGLRAVHGSMAFQLQQKQEALVREWGEDITDRPHGGAALAIVASR